MDGRMDGQMDGWVGDGQMDGWMVTDCIDWIDEQTDSLMDEN